MTHPTAVAATERAQHTEASAAHHALLHGDLTDRILGAFYEVYAHLGAGFLEVVYRRAMAIELAKRGVAIQSEVPVLVHYAGQCIGRFRADLVADNTVLIEVKAAERLVDAHDRQVLNYLYACPIDVALLLNFGPRATFRRFILTNERKRL